MKTFSEIDVAVVGGGPAGVAAATAASLGGAHSVLLLEAGPRLGGSVTAAMHRSLCGLYSDAPQSPLDTLNAGVQRDVIAAMMRLAPAAVIPRQFGRTWVLEFPAPAYEAALIEVCDQPNIQRLMNTRLTAVRRQGPRITAIQFQNKWINVGSVIDCSGSGALLQMIGPDVMLPADPQRMLGGYSIRLTDITGDPDVLRLQIPYVLAMAVAAGNLPHQARFTMFQPGPASGQGICKLAVHPDQFSTEQMQLLAAAIFEHLKSEIIGFSSAKMIETSPHAVPRDGRRLLGQKMITQDDVLLGNQHSPHSVHAWWPIEKWDITTGPTYAYPPATKHYDIPDQALQSAAVENLFAAGLCVSATADAAASIRASGICLATGAAAGRIAAHSVVSTSKE